MNRRSFYLLSAAVLAVTSLLFAQRPPAKTSAPAAAPASAKAALARGKKLYTEQCFICHFDTSVAKKVGPGLKGLSRRGAFADGKPITDDSLRVWIENGGKNMPAFKGMLSPENIHDLVVYAKSL